VAGWYELRRVPEDRSVEIAYFGLLPGHIGRGAGRALLNGAVQDAWTLGGGAGRVWLHTCTLDHPHAMRNYEARGFRPFKTEIYEIEKAEGQNGEG
jgi:GNAT superfamily N-acetyltransferase